MADWLREADWTLYRTYEGEEKIEIPELIETREGANWDCGWYKWVAINTGGSAGEMTLNWQGAMTLQAAALAVAVSILA